MIVFNIRKSNVGPEIPMKAIQKMAAKTKNAKQVHGISGDFSMNLELSWTKLVVYTDTDTVSVQPTLKLHISGALPLSETLKNHPFLKNFLLISKKNPKFMKVL